MPQRNPARNRDASTRSLAASAGEDRAALSGRPRKANASQYESVMHQGQYVTVMPQRQPRQLVPPVQSPIEHESTAN